MTLGLFFTFDLCHGCVFIVRCEFFACTRFSCYNWSASSRWWCVCRLLFSPPEVVWVLWSIQGAVYRCSTVSSWSFSVRVRTQSSSLDWQFFHDDSCTFRWFGPFPFVVGQGVWYTRLYSWSASCPYMYYTNCFSSVSIIFKHLLHACHHFGAEVLPQPFAQLSRHTHAFAKASFRATLSDIDCLATLEQKVAAHHRVPDVVVEDDL